MCARAPGQSCQIKVFVAPQRCSGAYLGCGYRRASVYLALLWTADRLDDELGLKGEAETGPRVCPGSLRPGLGRAVQSRSPTKSAHAGAAVSTVPNGRAAALHSWAVDSSHPF